ncbi:MAG: amino acid-binding protein [Methermicoccaceae archaeon]
MWKRILKKFSRFPAQERVVLLLLERGFQVSSAGKVVSGGIEIPHTHIAREVGVDRRVVDAAASMIAEDDELRVVFQNLQSIPFLKNVAPFLGLGVVIITPTDASKVGIVKDVTGVIARHGISIRQVVTDDTQFTKNPKLTVITEGSLPGESVAELLALDNVKEVTVY